MLHKAPVLSAVLAAALLFTACTKDDVPDPSHHDDGDSSGIPTVTVTTLAGKDGDKGNAEDGNGTSARFWNPTKMVYDDRNDVLYVADGTAIRSIDAQANVHTYMPLGVISGWSEILDMSLAPGAAGSLYIVTAEHDLLKIEPDGTSVKKTILADRIYGGDETGALNSADHFDGTHGVATGANGEIYFFNSFWNTMHKVAVTSWSPVEGTVSAFAGKPTTERSGTAWDFADGQGDAATFGGSVPDMASDAQGNLYVADYWNDELRVVTPNGAVSSLLKYEHGWAVDKDGAVGTAEANRVTQVTTTPDGKAIFFGTLGAGGNNTPRLRMVQNKKNVLTLTKSESTNATGTLRAIDGLACTPDGKTIFVAEAGYKVIRKVTIQ